MGEKTDLLKDIIGSLSDEETTMIEKTATDANALKNTENSEASKKIPTETPKKKEGKLGLSVLGKNKHEDAILDFNHVTANKQDKKGTEDIKVKLPRTEAGVTFEKRASEDVLAALYSAAGVDLSKVASEDTQEDLLMKIAAETLQEIGDLDKIAEDIADKAADRFIARISSSDII